MRKKHVVNKNHFINWEIEIKTEEKRSFPLNDIKQATDFSGIWRNGTEKITSTAKREIFSQKPWSMMANLIFERSEDKTLALKKYESEE